MTKWKYYRVLQNYPNIISSNKEPSENEYFSKDIWNRSLNYSGTKLQNSSGVLYMRTEKDSKDILKDKINKQQKRLLDKLIVNVNQHK